MSWFWCADCHESSDIVFSAHFGVRLCPDCFNGRCKDEGEPLTLEDLEELSEEIGL